ncbi:bola-like protein-domain-containing protein [Gloeopeniophorella convolvens]|nr:bola-like protein-domain-containing protein [Gloeopeniophorella convolvens]
MATAQDAVGRPVEQAIRRKLTNVLQPSILTITNDSWRHRHHAPMLETDGGNGETHFSVQVVSDAFSGKTTMQRHRMIYAALSEELENGLHALVLNTKTQAELRKAEVQTP